LYYKVQLTQETVLAETVLTTSEFQPYNTGHAAASPEYTIVSNACGDAAVVRRCRDLNPLNHYKSHLRELS